MNRMPTKDPGLWAYLSSQLIEHWAEISCFLLTVLIAFLRLYRAGSRGVQLSIDALLCGLLWWPVAACMEWLGVPVHLAGPLASSVGLIGVEALREAGMRLLTIKTGGSDAAQ